MKSLAVVTPSYAPDFELFKDLHRSVLDRTPASVVHYVIVPGRDVALFSELRGNRCVVWAESELLPRRMVPMPRTNARLNLRHPFPPVRGWVLQQIVKLAAAARIEVDMLLLVDSDVLLVRPLDADALTLNGEARFYRKPDAVDDRLPRHVKWHNVARRLLGLLPAAVPLPDYVTSFNVWDRQVVLALQQRVREATGRRWMDAVGAQLHFSEWTLYGVFVDALMNTTAGATPTTSTMCHSYWDPVPLDSAGVSAFLAGLSPEDAAVMISAKSRTPLATRREALSLLVSPNESDRANGKKAAPD